MDAGMVKPAVRKGSNQSAVVDSAVKVKKGEEAGEEEKQSLLPSAKKGGMAGRRKGNLEKRRVRWTDRNGNKLVQVLEFQPSDSSDSDDEYLDSCICTIM